MADFHEIFVCVLQGVVQGVAEFLPISSSGHLEVIQCMFGLGNVPPLFSIFLHIATLCAVVLYFRKKIVDLFAAFFRLILRKNAPTHIKNPDGSETILTESQAKEREMHLRRYILAVILSSAVTAVIGIAVEKALGELPIAAVFTGFLCTACLLIASAVVMRLRKKDAPLEKESPAWWQALLIGLMQGIGTLPGISRSGSTISGALFGGVDRVLAGEFSFIISIPAILGAFLLELGDINKVAESVGIIPLIAGCITSFVVGYVALSILMKIIRKGHLEWFALYLIPAGILGLLFWA